MLINNEQILAYASNVVLANQEVSKVLAQWISKFVTKINNLIEDAKTCGFDNAVDYLKSNQWDSFEQWLNIVYDGSVMKKILKLV